MARISPVNPAEASGSAKELLDNVKAKLGRVPNMMKTMAQSPAVLRGYLEFSGALANGVIDGKLREQIALAVCEANSCGYCVAAHSALGKMAGLSPDALLDSRNGHSNDPKTEAALQFARELVDGHGEVSDGDLAALREAGFGDPEIAEIVANVAL